MTVAELIEMVMRGELDESKAQAMSLTAVCADAFILSDDPIFSSSVVACLEDLAVQMIDLGIQEYTSVSGLTYKATKVDNMKVVAVNSLIEHLNGLVLSPMVGYDALMNIIERFTITKEGEFNYIQVEHPSLGKETGYMDPTKGPDKGTPGGNQNSEGTPDKASGRGI